MTDSKMWVEVPTAMAILKCSRNTIIRKAIEGKLLYRKTGTIQICRVSICRLCLKESFPEAEEYPLDCKICQYFNTKKQKKILPVVT